MPAEQFTDPLTGRRLRRRSLGSVNAGKLFLMAAKDGRMVICWRGPLSLFGTVFEGDLRVLVRRNRPILYDWDERTGLWRLCVLDPGQYALDGRELLRLERVFRRHLPPPRVKNIANRSRIGLGNYGIDRRTPIQTPPIETAQPMRLTRPAA